MDAIRRNSENTAKAYLTGLGHLNNLYPDYTAETILTAVEQKDMDEYELLDDFIAYRLQKAKPKTIRVDLAAVRSYFGYHGIYIIPEKFKHEVAKSAPRKVASNRCE